MTEHVSETIRYAILLPNGELAQNLPDTAKAINVDIADCVLPNGQGAWVWKNQADAREQLDQIRRAVWWYGLADIFTEHAQIVQIRTTTRMDIQPVSDDGDDTAPDHWASVADVPFDVYFQPLKPADSAFRWKRYGADYAQQWYGERYDGLTPRESLDQTWTDGFTEIAETIVDAEVEGLTEPRTWKTSGDIPHGARFTPIGDSERAEWSRGLAGTMARYTDEGVCMDVSRVAAMDAAWPEGFVEVLS